MKSQILYSATTQKVFLAWALCLAFFAVLVSSCKNDADVQPVKDVISPSKFSKIVDPETALVDEHGDENGRTAAIDPANRFYVHLSNGAAAVYFIQKDTALNITNTETIVRFRNFFTSYSPVGANGKLKKGIKKFSIKAGKQGYKMIDKNVGTFVWMVGTDHAGLVKYYPCFGSLRVPLGSGYSNPFVNMCDFTAESASNDASQVLGAYGMGMGTFFGKRVYWDYDDNWTKPWSLYKYITG